MKKAVEISAASIVFTVALYGSGLFAQPGTTYQNPLSVTFGDPYVLHDKGKYYMYGTGGGARNGLQLILRSTW